MIGMRDQDSPGNRSSHSAGVAGPGYDNLHRGSDWLAASLVSGTRPEYRPRQAAVAPGPRNAPVRNAGGARQSNWRGPAPAGEADRRFKNASKPSGPRHG